MDEVADVVGQEDGRTVHARPHRLRVVPDGHVELLVVGALLHGRAEVERRNGEDARELAGADPGHLARGTVTLCRDLGHGRTLAADQHRLRVILVLLVGQGVATGEDGAEEEDDPDTRDADTAQVTERRHRVRPRLPLLGTRFRHPVPSSSQHRFPLHLPLPPDPPKISPAVMLLCRPAPDRRGGSPARSRCVTGRSWAPACWPCAAAGPAPETGGGTEEVPKAGPGGGPPSDPKRIGCDGS